MIGFRIRVLGAMVGLNTLGDMQVRFQVGSDHPSDWIQDPSAWSHGWIVDPTNAENKLKEEPHEAN